MQNLFFQSIHYCSALNVKAVNIPGTTRSSCSLIDYLNRCLVLNKHPALSVNLKSPQKCVQSCTCMQLYLYSKVTNPPTTHYSFVSLCMQNLSAPHNHQLTLSFLPQSYHKLLTATLWAVPQSPFLYVAGHDICFCFLQ